MVARGSRILSLVVALAVVACTPTAQTPAAPAPAQVEPTAAPPAKLVVGINGLIADLDPHRTIGQNPRRYGLFECLVMQDATGAVEPALAASWKALNDTTWQFVLAPGRVFHDGTPVTVEDVKWSYDRGLDPANKLGIIARINTIKSVEIVDSRTVNLVTKAPDPLLIKRAALLVILSKAYASRVGDQALSTQPMGTGPFKFVEFKPNDRLVLTANRQHPRSPAVADLTIRDIPDSTARLNGLRGGELDAVAAMSVDQAEQLRAAGFTVVSFNQGRSAGAWMDTTIDSYPTRSKLVRQALNYAIDKEAIAKAIFKGYTRPEQGQFIQSQTFGFNPNLRPYPYDPAKAKVLLAEAGYPNGLKLKMDVQGSQPNADQVYLFIQQQLKEVGVEAEIFLYADSAAYLDRFYARVPRPPIMSTTVVNSPSMDADFAFVWFSGKRPSPERLYNNPEFDRLYDASTVEMNEAKRRELLQQAAAALYADPPHLFLTESFTLWAMKPSVTGITARADQEPAFEFVKKSP